MMNAAIHQMAAHISVPNYNSAGLTDAKLPDAQAGWEKAMTVLLGAMGGSNYMHHSAGMLESMLTVAHEQFVIDDEIIGMSCKVLKGIEVDAEHLALDVIDTVGPAGNFMMAPHTMKYMRSEYFQGNGVTDSKSRHQWEQNGSPDARERAKDIARRILGAEEKPYFSEAMDEALRAKFNILL
jgi:trimethylamine--corrinoid protein Co-methyltransferase